jgi:putative transposase
MKYDPKLHHRRSIRLKGYDYSQEGWYFVTICCKEKELYFERYNQLFEIIEDEWLNIPKRYENVDLDEYIIMPNHIHGIIVLKSVGAALTVTQNKYVGAPLAGAHNQKFKGRGKPCPYNRRYYWFI